MKGIYSDPMALPQPQSESILGCVRLVVEIILVEPYDKLFGLETEAVIQQLEKGNGKVVLNVERRPYHSGVVGRNMQRYIFARIHRNEVVQHIPINEHVSFKLYCQVNADSRSYLRTLPPSLHGQISYVCLLRRAQYGDPNDQAFVAGHHSAALG